MRPTLRRPLIHIGLWLLFALLWPGLAQPGQPVQGTATRGVDGDTLWAEADAHGTKLCMRLVGIDAPKVGHPRKGGGAGSPGCGRGAAKASPHAA